MTQLRAHVRILLVLFVVISGVGTTVLASGLMGPAHAERLGPGRVGVPGFSGYVSREGGELGVGRLADGTYGVCLDTGPSLRWPAGTPASHLVHDPRAALLLSSYLERARTDGAVAAALWWAVGGGLRLNSHPGRVSSHVAQLRREDPRLYQRVAGWHDRMMREAAGLAPGDDGYQAAPPQLAADAVSGLGVRSGTGQWVPGAAMTVDVSGTTLAGGGTVWHGTTGSAPVTLRLSPTTHAVQVRAVVSGLSPTDFRLYEGGRATQRVAARVAPVTVSTTARRAAPRLPLRVTKTAETGDLAGMVGVAVAVHRGSARGPVVARHTFVAADVRDGTASYSFPARLLPGKRYTVAVAHEPDGWVPERTTASLRAGATAVVHLVDDKIWQPTLATRASSQIAQAGQALHDSVTVADTGGDTLSGAWRLLGPLAPRAHGCAGLRWAKARIAAHGTFTVSGDGTYAVGETAPGTTGCYTYSEQLAGNATTRPVAWTTPGVATETSVVRSRPRIHTRVSHRRATAGATLVDRVRVSGLDAGVASRAVAAQWQLLGPVSPRHRSCGGLSWTGAPVVARGRFRVHHDGTMTVGRHRIAKGGCYTYRERLRATPTSAATPWAVPGLAAETATVLPRQPRVPRRPHVPAGGMPAGRAASASSRLQVPAVGLDAGLLSVAFHGDDLTPPADLRDGAVWRDGAALDAVVGTTVLVGHVADDHDRPGEFRRLAGVHRGATITTTAGGHTTTWRVTRIRLTPKRELPRSLFAQGLDRRLVLITCGNEVHYGGGRFHYRSNLVVEAVPR